MSVKERMVYYLDMVGMSRREFDQKSGLNQSMFSPNSIKKDTMVSTVKVFRDTFPTISLEWLLYGVGSMDHGEDYLTISDMYITTIKEKDEHIKLLNDIVEDNKEHIEELRDLVRIYKKKGGKQ